jgi:hypothetical protein
MAVTYIAEGMAPKTIWIPKTEYSIEKEKTEIRKDLAAREKEKPETYKV